MNLYNIIHDENRHLKLNVIDTFKMEDKHINFQYQDEIIYLLQAWFKFVDLDVENLYVIAYDYYYKQLGIMCASVGDFKSCKTEMRSVASFLLLSGARKFAVLHNHPDGPYEASDGDLLMNAEMKQMADLLGIELVNNLCVSWKGYTDMVTRDVCEFEEDEWI